MNYASRVLSPEIARRVADARFNKRLVTLPDRAIFAVAQPRGAPLVSRTTKNLPANLPGIRITCPTFRKD